MLYTWSQTFHNKSTCQYENVRLACQKYIACTGHALCTCVGLCKFPFIGSHDDAHGRAVQVHTELLMAPMQYLAFQFELSMESDIRSPASTNEQTLPCNCEMNPAISTISAATPLPAPFLIGIFVDDVVVNASPQGNKGLWPIFCHMPLCELNQVEKEGPYTIYTP